MNEVNLEAMANRATSLQTIAAALERSAMWRSIFHTASGEQAGLITPGESLVVRATYRANQRPGRSVFQVAIVDVDSGLVITTATSKATSSVVDGDGVIECRFDRLPLRPRQCITAGHHRRAPARFLRRHHRRSALRGDGSRRRRRNLADKRTAWCRCLTCSIITPGQG